MAGAAVQSPPALPVFPANREFYREFCKIAASGAPETVNNDVITGLPMRIPYSLEQGIILADQGILARKQGIFIGRNRKSPPDEIFQKKESSG